VPDVIPTGFLVTMAVSSGVFAGVAAGWILWGVSLRVERESRELWERWYVEDLFPNPPSTPERKGAPPHYLTGLSARTGGGPRCEVGAGGAVVLQCPASCPCTIERQRAVRVVARAVNRFVEGSRK
jgi:hypothetical protein